MQNLTAGDLETYIHNLTQLHQALTKLGLKKAARKAAKCVKVARKYLKVIKMAQD